MINPYFNLTGDEARGLLYGLLEVNKIQLKNNPDMPSVRELIGQGRVQYRQADPNEHWQSYREIVEQTYSGGTGYADCEDLAPAIAAEDQYRYGVDSIPVAYKPKDGLFHVVTAVPNGAQVYGGQKFPDALGAPKMAGYRLEDPSAAAGMKAVFGGLRGKSEDMMTTRFSGFRDVARSFAEGATGMPLLPHDLARGIQQEAGDLLGVESGTNLAQEIGRALREQVDETMLGGEDIFEDEELDDRFGQICRIADKVEKLKGRDNYGILINPEILQAMITELESEVPNTRGWEQRLLKNRVRSLELYLSELQGRLGEQYGGERRRARKARKQAEKASLMAFEHETKERWQPSEEMETMLADEGDDPWGIDDIEFLQPGSDTRTTRSASIVELAMAEEFGRKDAPYFPILDRLASISRKGLEALEEGDTPKAMKIGRKAVSAYHDARKNHPYHEVGPEAKEFISWYQDETASDTGEWFGAQVGRPHYATGIFPELLTTSPRYLMEPLVDWEEDAVSEAVMEEFGGEEEILAEHEDLLDRMFPGRQRERRLAAEHCPVRRRRHAHIHASPRQVVEQPRRADALRGPKATYGQIYDPEEEFELIETSGDPIEEGFAAFMEEKL